MGITKDQQIAHKQDKQWHFDHCAIEHEDDYRLGTLAWCEHGVDVTECLPDPIEPDPYDTSEANLNGL